MPYRFYSVLWLHNAPGYTPEQVTWGQYDILELLRFYAVI